MDSSLLREDSKHKRIAQNSPNCPKTWQAALFLCLAGVFFLSGVLVGCYVGVVHRCTQESKQDATPSSVKHQQLSEQIEKVPFIDILNNHQEVLLQIKNTTLTYAPACKRESLTDVCDDNLTYLQKILVSHKLFENYLNSYTVVASHSKAVLTFNNLKGNSIENSVYHVQLQGSLQNTTIQTDVKLMRDISNDTQLNKGIFVLMEYHKERTLQNLASLSGREIEGVIVYSVRDRCIPHDNFDGLDELFKSYNIPLHIFSCESQQKMKSFLRESSKLHQNDLSEDVTAKDPGMHISLQTTVNTATFHNVITTFYGSRDPDFIILVGASRCNAKGMEDWLRILSSVSHTLLDNSKTRRWSPYRSMKFVSWSPLGVEHFVKTYQVAWMHKVLLYFDLDIPDIDTHSSETSTQHSDKHSNHNSSHETLDKTLHIEVSSSLRPFANAVKQQLSFNNPDSRNIELVNSQINGVPSSTAQLLESSMGIPYMRIHKMPRAAKADTKKSKPEKEEDLYDKVSKSADEMLMKFFSTAFLSMVDGELLQLSTFETMKDLMQILKQLQSYSEETLTVKRKIVDSEEDKRDYKPDEQLKTLHASSSRLHMVCQNFESTLKSFSKTFESVYQARKTNDLLLRVDNQLRIILHQLSYIALELKINHEMSLSPFKANNSMSTKSPQSAYDILPRDLKDLKGLRDRCARCSCAVLEEEEIIQRLSHVNMQIKGLTKLFNVRD